MPVGRLSLLDILTDTKQAITTNDPSFMVLNEIQESIRDAWQWFVEHDYV